MMKNRMAREHRAVMSSLHQAYVTDKSVAAALANYANDPGLVGKFWNDGMQEEMSFGRDSGYRRGPKSNGNGHANGFFHDNKGNPGVKRVDAAGDTYFVTAGSYGVMQRLCQSSGDGNVRGVDPKKMAEKFPEDLSITVVKSSEDNGSARYLVWAHTRKSRGDLPKDQKVLEQLALMLMYANVERIPRA